MLARLFRRLFLQYLERAFDAGKLTFFGALEPLHEPWPAYVAAPSLFGDPVSGHRPRRGSSAAAVLNLLEKAKKRLNEMVCAPSP